MDVAGHDADLALARLDDAGAVGADEAGLALPHEGVLNLHHVVLGNTLCNAHGEFHLSLHRISPVPSQERVVRSSPPG